MKQSFRQWRDFDTSYGFDDRSMILDIEEGANTSKSIISDIDENIVNKRVIIEQSAEIDSVNKSVTHKRNKYSDDDDDTPIVRFNKIINNKNRVKRKIFDSDDDDNDDDDKDQYYTFRDSDSDSVLLYSSIKNNDDDNNDSEKHDDDDNDDDETFHMAIGFNNSDSNCSILSSSIKNKSKERKDTTHDNTRKDIKELKPNSSDPSLLDTGFIIIDDLLKQTNNDKIADIENKAFHDEAVTIELDSDFTSGQNSDCKSTRQKSSVGKVVQKRTIEVHKREQPKKTTATMKLPSEGNLEIFPDRGQKLQESIRQQKKEIKPLTRKLEDTPLVPLSSQEFKGKLRSIKEDILPSQFLENSGTTHSEYAHLDFIDNIPMKPTTFSKSKGLDKQAQATEDKELALTKGLLQDLHELLVTRPSENEKAEDPRGLKIPLMSHQQHALAWLLWREQQRPSGGILADDMGLGKTLTMIALIITTLNKEDSYDESDDDDNDAKSTRKDNNGGTLIVTPASVVSQWEKEVQNKCELGLLFVGRYYGRDRETIKKLKKKDIIITTYNILQKDFKINSALFKIKWKRVILDEAHMIKNYKSQTAEAACELVADKRWALTGTPIQNEELDLYSILKFLKYSPFDNLYIWKRWVDKTAGHQRLAAIMKTLMLRRTKQELMTKGEMENLPNKFIMEVKVELDHQEQLVHNQILVHSRSLFTKFLAKCTEKELDLHDKPTFPSNPNKEIRFTKTQNNLLAWHADIKLCHFFLFLLRLRQVCCYPSLIHAMLDQEDLEQSGINTENADVELVSRMNNISLSEITDAEEEEIGVDKRVTKNLLRADNPVFADNRISSKMKALFDTVETILKESNDKLIIVSQWAMLLEVIALHLHSIDGATFSKFTGNVAIKDRQCIIDSFNGQNSNPRILLLSLMAGGVGLNLVGGNHLLLFDIHWNPQLEMQVQDRIYRFGQKKDVYIYKFLCINTIEDHIKTLQKRKLEIAQSILTGDRNAVMKFTLNDLKSLFGFRSR